MLIFMIWKISKKDNRNSQKKLIRLRHNILDYLFNSIQYDWYYIHLEKKLISDSMHKSVKY